MQGVESDSIILQIFPHSEVSLPLMDTRSHPFLFTPVELTLNSGIVYQVGRKIDKSKTATRFASREERSANNVAVISDESPSISFRSKVVSRSHGELWFGKDGQVYYRDVGSSSGSFLNRLRLSPSGKDSRPYPLKSGDVIQLGVDYQGRQEEIYKAVLLKVFINRQNGPPVKTNRKKLAKAIRSLMAAMNPFDDGTDCSAVDCCICLNSMAPYQALFLAPCSHCFHYKCVTPLLGAGYMFQCPMCRQVANLEANVASDELSELDESIEEEIPMQANHSSSSTQSGAREVNNNRITLAPNQLENDQTMITHGLMDVERQDMEDQEPDDHSPTPEERQIQNEANPIAITVQHNLNDLISSGTPTNHVWAMANNAEDTVENDAPLALYKLLSSIQKTLKKGDVNASKALISMYSDKMNKFMKETCKDASTMRELSEIMHPLGNE